MTAPGTQPQDSTEILHRLIERHARTGRAVAVNFRELVPWVPTGERGTHFIHPYPAKLLRHIPAFFLSSDVLSAPGDTVLDPFCGSGTVLLEGLLHRRRAFGADANPLARLISSVKIASYDVKALAKDLKEVLRRADRYRSATPPPVDNLSYWFYPHATDQLAKLRRAIELVEDPNARAFFLVCFSVCVRRASLADPRLSVPVRLRGNQYPPGHAFFKATNMRLMRLRRQNVYQDYAVVTEANLERVAALQKIRIGGASAVLVGTDARYLRRPSGNAGRLRAGTVDLVLTSPPYVGAQKYIRASSLSLGWLGLTEGGTLRELEDKNIGREHFAVGRIESPPITGIPEADRRLSRVAEVNPLRAHIAATYLLEMREAFAETVRVLKPGGFMVLVAGSNRVGGLEFRTPLYLQQILEELGLTLCLRLVDAIRSRGLMTRRNATASVITRETVLLLQKPKCSHVRS